MKGQEEMPKKQIYSGPENSGKFGLGYFFLQPRIFLNSRTTLNEKIKNEYDSRMV